MKKAVRGSRTGGCHRESAEYSVPSSILPKIETHAKHKSWFFYNNVTMSLLLALEYLVQVSVID